MGIYPSPAFSILSVFSSSPDMPGDPPAHHRNTEADLNRLHRHRHRHLPPPPKVLAPGSCQRKHGPQFQFMLAPLFVLRVDLLVEVRQASRMDQHRHPLHLQAAPDAVGFGLLLSQLVLDGGRPCARPLELHGQSPRRGLLVPLAQLRRGGGDGGEEMRDERRGGGRGGGRGG